MNPECGVFWHRRVHPDLGVPLHPLLGAQAERPRLLLVHHRPFVEREGQPPQKPLRVEELNPLQPHVVSMFYDVRVT